MSTAFDRALEAMDALADADAAALRHGEPGTAAHRIARLGFGRQVRVGERVGPRGATDKHTDQLAAMPAGNAAATVLNAAIRRAIQIDGAPMATAQLVDPRDRSLRLLAHHGFSSEFVAFFETVADDATSCGSALATGRPVWVADVTSSPIFAGTHGLEVLLNAGSRAVASLPITARNGQVLAMISPHHKQPVSWTVERQLALLRVAQLAGRVLEHLMGSDRPQPPGFPFEV